MFWQPDLATTAPTGNWDLLGVNTFVPQWSVVESKSWFDHDTSFPKWEKNINFKQLNQEPWAKNIILGLAGEYNEKIARSNVLTLGEHSKQIIQNKISIFKRLLPPIEADPTWLCVRYLRTCFGKIT
jgi:hypothetical protein